MVDNIRHRPVSVAEYIIPLSSQVNYTVMWNRKQSPWNVVSAGDGMDGGDGWRKPPSIVSPHALL